MRKWSCAFYLPCNFVWLELPINFWWTDFIMMWWALIDWFWQAQIGIDLRCVCSIPFRRTWKISWFHEWFYYLHAFITLLITWKNPMGIIKLISYLITGRRQRFEAASFVIWSPTNWSTSISLNSDYLIPEWLQLWNYDGNEIKIHISSVFYQIKHSHLRNLTYYN